MRTLLHVTAKATIYALCAYVLALALVNVIGAVSLAMDAESPFRALEKALRLK